MSDVRFTEMMAADIEEQNQLSDALGRVQRVSLALLAFAFIALVATIIDRRWFPIMAMTALAGATGMIVQATGRLRIIAAAVNGFVALMYLGGLVATMISGTTADRFVLALVTLIPIVTLSALNTYFILRVPRDAQRTLAGP